MALPTMNDEIKKFTDSPHYDRALRALQPGFITSCKTLEDVIDRSECLESAMKLLGPRDPQFRKSLVQDQQALRMTIKDRLLPARGYDQAIDEIQEGWQEACEIFKRWLPADAWAAIESKTVSLFDKLREPQD